MGHRPGLLAETEAQFQKTVIEYARTCGWRVAHFRTAQTSKGAWVTPVAADGAGFPDLCMIRADRIVFAELKRRGVRKVRPDQALWHAAINHTAAEMYVWNPLDWDQIQTVLR